MNNFCKDRDEAFIEAVVNDKWDKLMEFAKEYSMPLPIKQDVMKAGVYKAVQYCTNIPEDVKSLAMKKCLELGFNPLINPE